MVRIAIGVPLLTVSIGLLVLDAVFEAFSIGIAAPNRPFAGFLTVLALPCSIAMAWEIRRMLATQHLPTLPVMTVLAAPVLIVLGYVAGTFPIFLADPDTVAATPQYLQAQAFWVAALVFGGLFALTVATWVRVLWSGGASAEDHQRRALTAIGTMFVVAVVGLPFAFAVVLRLLPQAGLALVLVAVLASRLGDVGAFFAGRTFGRHKLIVAVSPKKTIEGTIGGLIVSGLTAWLVGQIFDLSAYLPGWWLPIAGVVLGAAAQIGDLLASALKRWAGFKDSSTLIPEFGGILDLLDGLLFSIPLLYFILLLRAAATVAGYGATV